ncbi:MAG: SDR family oxidoreductase [Balneolaceae bacterium]|nr:SDR family oxidoreductase [Balneolaceae bacterium]
MDISILGCGWLGTPLAESLLQDGHRVRGSTTSQEKVPELRDKGIDAFRLSLDPKVVCEHCPEFWESEVLVLNIPPGRGREDVESFFPAQVENVLRAVEGGPLRHLVFASSTSVYPPNGGVVEEEDAQPGEATRPSGEALLKAEQMLLGREEFRTDVLRFGGLYGPGRHPVRYLAGRKGLGKGNAPVNLIHLDDCISVIRRLIELPESPGILNAVSDGHPPRKLFYPRMAEKMGLDPPVFNEDSHRDYKIASNRKLKEVLDYTFAHPDPMN